MQAALKTYAGLDCEIVGGANDDALVTITLERHRSRGGLSPVDHGGGIRIAGDDAAGAFYGALTLVQLLQTQRRELCRCWKLRTTPTFPARGVMLDISRDKVPTMETLYGLIDLAGEPEDQPVPVVHRAYLRLSQASD